MSRTIKTFYRPCIDRCGRVLPAESPELRCPACKARQAAQLRAQAEGRDPSCRACTGWCTESEDREGLRHVHTCDATPPDACGPDCDARDCLDRVACEGCSARPHRDDATAHDMGRDDYYLCRECEPQPLGGHAEAGGAMRDALERRR